MSTFISLSNGFGVEPITVPDDMPRDELLLEMERMASEADAAMGNWATYDMDIVVRAWPNDSFDTATVIELRHPRQRYSAEFVSALIAEDAGLTGNPLASLHGGAR